MTKKFLLLSLVGLFALTLAGCGQKTATTTNTPADTKTETAQKTTVKTVATNQNSNTAPSTARSENITQANTSSSITNQISEPALGSVTILPTETTTETNDIKVTSPKKDEIIPSPFLITGQARSSDNQIYIKMIRDDGRVIMEEFSSRIKNAKPGEWGEFSTKPWYEVVHSETANLEVYTKDENSEIVSKVIVPIKFQKSAETKTE